MRNVEIVSDGYRFPEAPRWRDGSLWFSDMHAGRVYRLDPDSGTTAVQAELPGHVSGIGWDTDGNLLVVSMLDRRVVKIDSDGERVDLADLASLATFHANDMLVDPKGRAYVGNFGFDLLGGEPTRAALLALVSPTGEVSAAADDLYFPNGAVLTPDGSTLIVAETVGDRLTAFDVESDGSLSHRRTWAQLAGVRPDGICLDEDGCIWAASPARGAVIRVAEGGEIVDEVTMPRRTFACALGGADRRTLFVCIARSSAVSATAVDPGGAIAAVEVDAAGVGHQ